MRYIFVAIMIGVMYGPYAGMFVHAETEKIAAARQQTVPLVSIAEAIDLPGWHVTVQGTVKSSPTDVSAGRFSAAIEDGTGSIRFIIDDGDAEKLRKGDIIQITGTIGNADGEVIMRVKSGDIR